MSDRREKIKNLLKELSANFIQRENNQTSLITVTDTSISKDMKRGTIFISVMPVEKEKPALDFLKRQRSDLRDYIKKNMNTKVVPFLEIEIDKGEKNRQKIEKLLRE
jgi:ribosome-binding factor A